MEKGKIESPVDVYIRMKPYLLRERRQREFNKLCDNDLIFIHAIFNQIIEKDSISFVFYNPTTIRRMSIFAIIKSVFLHIKSLIKGYRAAFKFSENQINEMEEKFERMRKNRDESWKLD